MINIKDVIHIINLSEKFGDRANSEILSHISDNYQTFEELIANILTSKSNLKKDLPLQDFKDLIIFQCGVLFSKGLIEEQIVNCSSNPDGYYYKVRGLNFEAK